jgi:flagellar basal-body rod modification protein FlgD
MPVDGVTAASPATTAWATSTTASAPSQEMDSDIFMSLLITQLKNQDPSSPMDTNEMITQTTQLATMEKLASMESLTQETFSLQMRGVAADLIGQTVSYTGADDATVSGVATAVSFVSGVPTVTVGETEVPLDSITGITK